MTRSRMSGRERILAAVRHEEPDRVPICPRVWAWLTAEYGDAELDTQLRVLPDMDPMHVVPDGTPNTLDSYPDEYRLPGVQVEQKKYREGAVLVVQRTFRTPAGTLSDRTMIPPGGREYGVAPNPVKTEHLVKSREDLEPLKYVLHGINTNFDFLSDCRARIGDRGVVAVCVRSALDHNAGFARDMQDLMVDYYEDRPLFNDLLGIFHARSLAQIRAALEGGAEFIFGSWYFSSLSAGWSPAIFAEVFAPLIREHADLTHRYGAHYDYYDDGKLADSMETIAAAGVDVLETCTPPPIGDFDLALAKRTIGRKTALKGYVDLLQVMKNGTPELVEQTVREALRIAKPGGGFLLGSSDSFREGTPRENIAAYFAAGKKYGTYG